MLSKVHEIELSNGFRALLVERRNLPVVATMTWYRVGSRDERTGETGLSHFLEHMMFKGTAGYAKGEIDLVTAKLGGSNNAFTDNDSTAYYFSLASDRWETALEIEASRMRGCLLDPAEFEAEKSVVLEELAMGEDDPWRSLWQGVEALTFQVHPYHHPVIGWKQDLERVDARGMRSYYERHYGPNRAFLVAVGDFDVKPTAKRISQLFGSVEQAEARDPVIAEPPLVGERRGIIRAPGRLTRLARATHTCRMGERDDFTLDVLAHVLGAGKSSRLYRRLVVQDELATQVSVYNETRLDPGMFWIDAELRVGADPERADAVIQEELERVAHDGITASELKRARVQIRSSFLFEDETALDTATKIGRFEALAAEGYRLLDSVLPTYDDINRREIRETAARYFGVDGFVGVWSLPADEPAVRSPAKSGRKTRARVARKSQPAKRGAKKKGPKKKTVRKKKAAKKPAPAAARRRPKPKPKPRDEGGGR